MRCRPGVHWLCGLSRVEGSRLVPGGPTAFGPGPVLPLFWTLSIAAPATPTHQVPCLHSGEPPHRHCPTPPRHLRHRPRRWPNSDVRGSESRGSASSAASAPRPRHSQLLTITPTRVCSLSHTSAAGIQQYVTVFSPSASCVLTRFAVACRCPHPLAPLPAGGP
jgi:hypothetical protein